MEMPQPAHQYGGPGYGPPQGYRGLPSFGLTPGYGCRFQQTGPPHLYNDSSRSPHRGQEYGDGGCFGGSPESLARSQHGGLECSCFRYQGGGFDRRRGFGAQSSSLFGGDGDDKCVQKDGASGGDVQQRYREDGATVIERSPYRGHLCGYVDHYDRSPESLVSSQQCDLLIGTSSVIT